MIIIIMKNNKNRTHRNKPRSFHSLNLSPVQENQFGNHSPPLTSGDKCKAFIGNTSEIRDCEVFDYGGFRREHSIIVEFDLVCGKAYLDNLCNTIFFIGILLGNAVFGPLSDHLGRKPVLIGCALVMAVNGGLTLFVNSYPMYVAIRFVAGFIYAGGCFTTWTYSTELFSSNYRLVPGLAIYGAGSIGLITAAGFAYLLPQWRHLYACLSLLALLSLPSLFIFPESLFWLVRKGRIEEAKVILRKYAERNGLDFDQILSEQPRMTTLLSQYFSASGKSTGEAGSAGSAGAEEGTTEASKCVADDEGALDTTKPGEVPIEYIKPRKWTPLYILCLVVMSFLWMVVTLVYFGLQFSLQEFSDNRFLSGFLFGIIEAPAVLFCILVVCFTTRRFSTLLFLTISGAPLLVLAIVRTAVGGLDENSNFAFGMSLIGKFGTSAAFSLVNILAAELFPTNVRSTSYHVAVGCSRIAALGATFASVLFRSKPLIPEYAFGVLGILAALSAIFIPETKDQPLPQIMEDLDVMKKSTKHICNLCPRAQPENPSDEIVISNWDKNRKPSKSSQEYI